MFFWKSLMIREKLAISETVRWPSKAIEGAQISCSRVREDVVFTRVIHVLTDAATGGWGRA